MVLYKLQLQRSVWRGIWLYEIPRLHYSNNSLWNMTLNKAFHSSQAGFQTILSCRGARPRLLILLQVEQIQTGSHFAYKAFIINYRCSNKTKFTLKIFTLGTCIHIPHECESAWMKVTRWHLCLQRVTNSKTFLFIHVGFVPVTYPSSLASLWSTTSASARACSLFMWPTCTPETLSTRTAFRS